MNDSTTTEVDAVTEIALAKMTKKASTDKARGLLSVGKHYVNKLIRVKGYFQIFADEVKPVTASLPQKKMLLAALMLNGVSVKAFIKRYNDGEFEVSKEQEKEIDAIWKELASEVIKTTKGKVTTKLEYGIVEEVEVAEVEEVAEVATETEKEIA